MILEKADELRLQDFGRYNAALHLEFGLCASVRKCWKVLESDGGQYGSNQTYREKPSPMKVFQYAGNAFESLTQNCASFIKNDTYGEAKA